VEDGHGATLHTPLRSLRNGTACGCSVLDESEKNTRTIPIPIPIPIQSETIMSWSAPSCSSSSSSSSKRRPNKTSQASSASASEIVEQARREREGREALRKAAGHALRVQKWWRGRSDARVRRKEVREDYERKLSDIINLRSTLSSRGVPFSLPHQVTLKLMGMLVYFNQMGEGGGDKKELDCLATFCREIALPSIRRGPDLALLLTSGKDRQLRLRRFLSKCLRYAEARPCEAMLSSCPVIETLLILCGSPEHARARSGFIDEDGEKPLDAERTCLDFCLGLDLLGAARRALLSISEESASSAQSSGKEWGSGIWKLCIQALANNPPQSTVAAFVGNLLTVPCLRGKVGPARLRECCCGCERATNVFERCLRECSALLDLLPQPPAGLEGISTATFLLSNVAACAAGATAEGLVDWPYEAALDTLSFLLFHVSIPSTLLQDRGGVAMHQNSSGAVIAVAIPAGIAAPLRDLLSPPSVRFLAQNLLRGIDTDSLAVGTEEELREAKEAANMSATAVAAASVVEQQERERAPVLTRLFKIGKRALQSFTTNREPPPPPPPFPSALQDCSAQSRAAAAVVGGGAGAGASRAHHSYSSGSVVIFCRFLGAVLARWGVTAVIDGGTDVATVRDVMNTLSFSTNVAARLWAFAVAEGMDRTTPTDEDIANGRGPAAVLGVAAALIGYTLVVTDDEALYLAGKPLPLHHIRRFIESLKLLLFRECWQGCEGEFQPFLRASLETSLGRLRDRDARKPLVPRESWLVPQAKSNIAEFRRKTERARRVLSFMPYCLSLTDRMRLLAEYIAEDRAIHQPENVRGIQVRIRRGFALEDGLANMDRMAGSMKKRIQVIYTSLGREEPGIDMGGLFKDFWTELANVIFDAGYGLFKTTEDGLLYPNPSSALIHGSEHTKIYRFMGRILGKALYEQLTVQPQFAYFFLGFIRGRYDFLTLFQDLASLDRELYRSLALLGCMPAAELDSIGLTFTVTEESLGAAADVELLPRGESIAVTAQNRHEYMHRVAK
jgi:hypothetical protein